METPIKTEKAQIYGGPLDGYEFTVAKDNNQIAVGSAIHKHEGETYWKPSSNPQNTLKYFRAGQRTSCPDKLPLFSNVKHISQPAMA
jgi:hypothetical protein